MIDFHSHIIPGVDDGSESLEQSLEALGRMQRQGISHVITTPHFRASTLNDDDAFGRHIALIDSAWVALEDATSRAFPDLRLSRGLELALDEPLRRSPDKRVCLAGTRFVLVEFPYFSVPPNSWEAVLQLRRLGVTPIVAHPERYENLNNDLSVLDAWKRNGAFLQINAGSLVGAYGSRVLHRGWKILERGLADYLSSDYHARGDCLTAAAQSRFSGRHADSEFVLLTRLNGERLCKGQDPTPVHPVPARGLRGRLNKILGGLRSSE